MRYSEYFVQVALLAQNGDKETAEKLLPTTLRCVPSVAVVS